MKNAGWIIAALVGLWVTSSLAKSSSTSTSLAGKVGSAQSFDVAPGIVESGTKNATGGFTVSPDPNGIGGGFAT